MCGVNSPDLAAEPFIPSKHFRLVSDTNELRVIFCSSSSSCSLSIDVTAFVSQICGAVICEVHLASRQQRLKTRWLLPQSSDLAGHFTSIYRPTHVWNCLSDTPVVSWVVACMSDGHHRLGLPYPTATVHSVFLFQYFRQNLRYRVALPARSAI